MIDVVSFCCRCRCFQRWQALAILAVSSSSSSLTHSPLLLRLNCLRRCVAVCSPERATSTVDEDILDASPSLASCLLRHARRYPSRFPQPALVHCSKNDRVDGWVAGCMSVCMYVCVSVCLYVRPSVRLSVSLPWLDSAARSERKLDAYSSLIPFVAAANSVTGFSVGRA